MSFMNIYLAIISGIGDDMPVLFFCVFLGIF